MLTLTRSQVSNRIRHCAAIVLLAAFLLSGGKVHAGVGNCALCVTLTGSALQVTVTGTTTSGSGTDWEGIFLNPGDSLAGQSFQAVYSIATGVGTDYGGVWPSCYNGQQNSGFATPVVTAVVTIPVGGRSYIFGAGAPSSLTTNVFRNKAPRRN